MNENRVSGRCILVDVLCFSWIHNYFLPFFFLAVAHTWYWGSGHHVRGGPVCHEDHPEQRAADSWALSSKHSLEVCVFVLGQVKMPAYFQLSHIRMVHFPFPREDQTAHRPFTHMQICTQFVLINFLIHPHFKCKGCISPSAENQTHTIRTKRMHGRACNMHLVMWLWIFVFRLELI